MNQDVEKTYQAVDEPVTRPLTTPEYDSLTTDVATIRWFSKHAAEIADPTTPAALDFETVTDGLRILNKNLELDPNRNTHVMAASLFKNYCRLSGIDPEGNVPDEILEKLIVVIEKFIIGQESDPRTAWNASMLRQSLEKTPELFATLVGRGGVWRTTIEPDEPSTTGGAKELLRAVAAGSLIFAQNAAEHATEVIPFHPSPPKPKGRELVKKDALKYLEKAAAGTLSWQKHKHQEGITQSHAENAAPTDVLTKTTEGKTRYREFGKFETMPVRVWRENEVSEKLEYVDVPLDELSGSDPDSLKDNLTLSESALLLDRPWTEAPETPDMSEDAPIMSISMGKSTRVDSELFEHARSGKTILHMHYNTFRGRMELYWNHASVDGVPGKAMSFAIARAIGATKVPSPREIEIEWFPATQTAEMPNSAALKWLHEKIILKELQKKGTADYLNHPDLSRVVYSMHLSDVTVHREMAPKDVQRIERVVKAINTKWYKPIEKKIRALLEKDPLPKEAEKALLNRLAASKMTVNKYIDLMSRNFFGPTAVCMLPRDERERLMLGLVPILTQEMIQGLLTYSYRKFENNETRVFESLDAQTLTDTVLDAYKLMQTEYAIEWLLGFTTLTALQESTSKFRNATEYTAMIADETAYEGSLITNQTSFVKDLVLRDKDGNIVAVIAGFTSAQTWGREFSFALGLGGGFIPREDGNALSFDYRMRMTPEMLESLRMWDENALLKAVHIVAEQLGQGDSARTLLLELASQEALSAMYRTKKLYYKDGQTGVSNCLLLTRVLSEHPELEDGMNVLAIAGMYDLQDRFEETLLAGADEMADAIEAL